MKALDLVIQKLKLSNISSIKINGIKSKNNSNLDCDCVDGDCSTENYCEN